LAKKRDLLISTKKGSSVMLQLQNKPHDGRAKDGEIELSLAMSEPMVGVERMVGRRAARSQSLAVAGACTWHAVCQRTAYRSCRLSYNID